MPALRVLWHALVGLYDEMITLVLGNLLWVCLNLPVYLLLLAVGVPFLGGGVPESGPGWLLLLPAWLLILLPTPAGIALGGLASVATGPDAPHARLFWEALRTRWRLALGCCGLSLVGTVALLANLYFYAVLSSGWPRVLTILWLYAIVLWAGMHVYLVPLLHHVRRPRLLDLYRRAALIALGHAGYTLVVVLGILLLGLSSVLFLPAYLLVGGAYVALAQAHAFREIRRRHGDLVVAPEPDKGSVF